MIFKDSSKELEALIQVVKELRTPETGCPWDLEQDHQTLRPYMIEEAYEAIEAIDKQDDALLCEELGDVLLQVVIHGQVAADRNAFSLAEIAHAVTEKMIRRHPHVFGKTKVANSDEVLKNWEAIKVSEKGNSKDDQTSKTPFSDNLSKIPHALPALLRAQRSGQKAAKVHFDWSELSGVLAKVREEIAELEAEIKPLISQEKQEPFSAQELAQEQRQRLEHEMGDALFSLCQLSRWLGLSAEDSLRLCISRFLERFENMERTSTEPLDELSPEKLENLWENAKKG